MKPVIVLVHVGNVFADYINECISQIRKFNDCSIYLVLSKQHFNLVKNEVKLIGIEDLQMSENHLNFLSSSERDPNFRDGFWKSVVERFYIIEDVIQNYKLEHVFHFENDNMVYCNLEEILLILDQNKISSAAPFDNDLRCIPSFVYFKNEEVLSKLNQFMFLYPNRNDMELIAMFNKEYNLIEMLPLIPFNYDLKLQSKSGFVVKNEERYKKNFSLFHSVFDAAAIGQYLGGIDSRNVKFNFFKRILKHKVKFVNESAVYDVSKFSYYWEKDQLGRKIPYLNYRGENVKINNLHIHSKKLKDFR
jgi:hypothetical protein